MTEEEKKAIEYLQAYIKIMNNAIDADIDYYTKVEPVQKRAKYLETIKNLIEKLQKENEELKNKVIIRDNDIIYLEETAEKEFITKQEIKENYIPKDKIRDRLLVVTDLKSKIDLSKKETPVEFYVLDYVNNLLDELLEEE